MHRMLILPSQTLFQQPTMPSLVIHAWKWSVRKCLFIWTYLDGLCSLWLPPHARRLHASTISTILRSTFSTSCHIAAHFSVSVPSPDKGVTSTQPVHRCRMITDNKGITFSGLSIVFVIPVTRGTLAWSRSWIRHGPGIRRLVLENYNSAFTWRYISKVSDNIKSATWTLDIGFCCRLGPASNCKL